MIGPGRTGGVRWRMRLVCHAATLHRTSNFIESLDRLVHCMCRYDRAVGTVDGVVSRVLRRESNSEYIRMCCERGHCMRAQSRYGLRKNQGISARNRFDFGREKVFTLVALPESLFTCIFNIPPSDYQDDIYSRASIECCIHDTGG